MVVGKTGCGMFRRGQNVTVFGNRVLEKGESGTVFGNRVLEEGECDNVWEQCAGE
jgi:hypothetical protein